jgi:hypothetical protein
LQACGRGAENVLVPRVPDEPCLGCSASESINGGLEYCAGRFPKVHVSAGQNKSKQVVVESMASKLLLENTSGERGVADASHRNAIIREAAECLLDSRHRLQPDYSLPDNVLDCVSRHRSEDRRVFSQPSREQELAVLGALLSLVAAKRHRELSGLLGIGNDGGDTRGEIEPLLVEHGIADIEEHCARSSR